MSPWHLVRADRGVQRGPAVVVLNHAVGPAVEEELHELLVAILNGVEEGRLALLVLS